MLYILLELKVIRMNWISDGAEFLLATMVFFFIPSVVGIMDVVSDITKELYHFLLINYCRYKLRCTSFWLHR